MHPLSSARSAPELIAQIHTLESRLGRSGDEPDFLRAIALAHELRNRLQRETVREELRFRQKTSPAK